MRVCLCVCAHRRYHSETDRRRAKPDSNTKEPTVGDAKKKATQSCAITHPLENTAPAAGKRRSAYVREKKKEERAQARSKTKDTRVCACVCVGKGEEGWVCVTTFFFLSYKGQTKIDGRPGAAHTNKKQNTKARNGARKRTMQRGQARRAYVAEGRCRRRREKWRRTSFNDSRGKRCPLSLAVLSSVLRFPPTCDSGCQ